VTASVLDELSMSMLPALLLTYSYPSRFILNWLPKRLQGKVQGKVHPTTGHEGPEAEYRYSSTLSLTSAIDGVGGQRYAPAALPPGKDQYPL
jgi:hypothetical protein